MENNIKDTIADAFLLVADNLKKHKNTLQKLHTINLWLEEGETGACKENSKLVIDALNVFIHLGFMVENNEQEIISFTESYTED